MGRLKANGDSARSTGAGLSIGVFSSHGPDHRAGPQYQFERRSTAANNVTFRSDSVLRNRSGRRDGPSRSALP